MVLIVNVSTDHVTQCQGTAHVTLGLQTLVAAFHAK